MEKRERFVKSLTGDDLRRMMIPRRHWSCSLDEVYDGGSPNPQRVVRNYVNAIHRMVSIGAGLILHGANGYGKSGAAVVIAKWARRFGFKVLFMPAADIKDVKINRVRFDDDETMWERAKSVDVLVLDDLGKGTTDAKGFGERSLDELIRHRNSERRPTVITTNMAPKDLSQLMKFSTSKTVPESFVVVEMHGVDRRQGSMHDLRSELFA